jgi:hypothetical protein
MALPDQVYHSVAGICLKPNGTPNFGAIASHTQTSGTSISATITPSAGSTLVAFVVCITSFPAVEPILHGGVIAQPTDNHSQTWKPNAFNNETTTYTNLFRTTWFYAFNVTGSSTTVSCTVGQGIAAGIFLYEVKNVPVTDPIDDVVFGFWDWYGGNGTGSGVAGHSGDMMLAADVYLSATPAAPVAPLLPVPGGFSGIVLTDGTNSCTFTDGYMIQTAPTLAAFGIRASADYAIVDSAGTSWIQVAANYGGDGGGGLYLNQSIWAGFNMQQISTVPYETIKIYGVGTANVSILEFQGANTTNLTDGQVITQRNIGAALSPGTLTTGSNGDLVFAREFGRYVFGPPTNPYGSSSLFGSQINITNVSVGSPFTTFTYTNAAGQTLLSLGGPVGLANPLTVSISGCTNAGNNGHYTLSSVPTSTQFKIVSSAGSFVTAAETGTGYVQLFGLDAFTVSGGAGAQTPTWFTTDTTTSYSAAAVAFPNNGSAYTNPLVQYANDGNLTHGDNAVYTTFGPVPNGGNGYNFFTTGNLVLVVMDDLNVNNPGGDFTIAASPSSLDIFPLQVGHFTITTTALGGFGDFIILTVSGVPSGVNASFSVNNVPLHTVGGGYVSLLNLVVTGSVTPGSYTLTITGTAGTLTHSTTCTLVIDQMEWSLRMAGQV